MKPISKLSELQNIGPKSEMWLNEIGIYTLSDLEDVGPVEAYRQIKELGCGATLNLVYAIQGAIINCPWDQLPVDMRERLRREVANITNERNDV